MNKDLEKNAETWYQFGVFKLDQDQFLKAIEYFKKAVSFKENYKDCYALICKASEALQKPRHRVTLADQWLY